MDLRFDAGTRRLTEEFKGVFSPETVREVVADSAAGLSGSRVQIYVPLLTERFARERLTAVAQVGGKIMKEVPEVLFVCVHNAGRSQMAAALLDHHARGVCTSGRRAARRPTRSTRPWSP